MSKQIDIDQDPVRVSRSMGKRASIGPIPADLLFPWMTIGFVAYFIIRMMLAGSLILWAGCWFWLAVTYWALAGNRAYRYFKQWQIPPGQDWINGDSLFVRVTDQGLWKRKRKESQGAVLMQTDEGVKRFMPFQKYCHLHSIAEIQIGGHKFACLLLHNPRSDQWSAQIPFKFTGLHPQLYRQEVEETIDLLRRGIQELPEREALTFYLGCSTDIRERYEQLNQLAESTSLAPVSVLLLNEQKRIFELANQGVRQVWSQSIWAGWTAQYSEEQKTDNIGKALMSLQRWVQKGIRSFVGTEQTFFNNFYRNLAQQVYEQGYLEWRNLLETKCGLEVAPMSAQEAWEWLWYRFNKSTAPILGKDQYIQIRETERGLSENVPMSGQKDLITLLIQGEKGKTSVPRHKQQHGYIYVNEKVGKVVVLEDPPDGWRNAREQLNWIWTRMSSSYVRDTEVVIQVRPKETWVTRDELEKMSRQSHTELRRAIEDGTGRVVHANLAGEQAADALRKVLEGVKPLYCAPVFIIWRNSEAECEEAAIQLTKSFGTATAVTEDDISWQLWLDSLPINDELLLKKFSTFSERRLTLDSESVIGFLPIVKPRPLDAEGVEFLTERGGQPVHLNMFGSSPGRIIITGTSGSGKSVLGWRFIEEALARNIPVVGLDLSTGGDNTFRTAVEMLGERGVYVDILNERMNLMEPPDLRNLPPNLAIPRFKRWKDFIRQAIMAISMGQIQDQELQERVDSITLRLLEVFFADSEMIDRYNAAFEGGYKSPEWQLMPTAHELLRFCSREKLKLESYEEIDARAINQIVSQLGAKLVDPNIGDVIGRPSTVNPNPIIKFYALSGLSNDSNSYIMAITAQMACLRNALSAPQSLFVGDELSVLLSKNGFADMVGEMLATGRKEGVASLLLAQDLDAIVTCSAAAKIKANITTTITGYTTHAALDAYTSYLHYDSSIIGANATEKFRGNRSEMYTRWLIERSGRFWQTRSYSPPLAVAALANEEDEKMARNRVLMQYPQTERGYLAGLSAFSKEYVAALRGSQPMQDIGVSDLEKFQSRRRVSA